MCSATEAQEDFVIQQAQQYKDFAWMHSEAAKRYSRLNRISSIPLAVCSAITSSSSFLNLAGSTPGQAFSTTIAVITLVQAVLVAIITVFDFRARSSNHKRCADGFTRLAHKIQQEVLKPPPARSNNLAKFVTDVQNAADDLQQSAIDLPEFARSNFESEFKRKCSSPILHASAPTLETTIQMPDLKRNSGSTDTTYRSLDSTATSMEATTTTAQ